MVLDISGSFYFNELLRVYIADINTPQPPMPGLGLAEPSKNKLTWERQLTYSSISGEEGKMGGWSV